MNVLNCLFSVNYDKIFDYFLDKIPLLIFRTENTGSSFQHFYISLLAAVSYCEFAKINNFSKL